jgi:ABC-type uncharacterized transport system substrate-binding protein
MMLSAVCLGGVTKAHPHVFADARTGFVFGSDRQLEAIKISWLYDEFTTLVLFETLELDLDQDGQLNDSDRIKILEGETNWPQDYKGDIYLEVLGQDYPLGRPKTAAVKLDANQIEVTFDLPLSKPTEVDSSPILLRLYDPFFYFAYTIVSVEASPDLPEDCEAQIVHFDPTAAESVLQDKLAALGREDRPEIENVGRLFSDEVQLTCG